MQQLSSYSKALEKKVVDHIINKTPDQLKNFLSTQPNGEGMKTLCYMQIVRNSMCDQSQEQLFGLPLMYLAMSRNEPNEAGILEMFKLLHMSSSVPLNVTVSDLYNKDLLLKSPDGAIFSPAYKSIFEKAWKKGHTKLVCYILSMSSYKGIDPFFEQVMYEDNSFGKDGTGLELKSYDHFKNMHENQMKMVVKHDYQGILTIIESDECVISINNLNNIPALKKFISEQGSPKAQKLLQLASHEKGSKDSFKPGRFKGLQVKKSWVNPLLLQGLFSAVGMTVCMYKDRLSKK